MTDRIEQLEQMRMGVDMRHPVRLRAFSCMLRPLTMVEMVNVASEVKDTLMNTNEAGRTPLMQSALTARKTLELASTGADGEPGVLTGYILDKMTPDEIIYLYNEYQAIVDRVNPSVEEMSPETLQELIDAVKKNPSQLTGLSFSQVVKITKHLLSQDG